MEDSLHHPICAWDFGSLEVFPEGSANHGCHLTREAGLELEGHQAYVTLPFRLPHEIPCLRSRTMIVCVRFVTTGEGPQTGLIAIGLDDPLSTQFERLVFGFEGSDFNHFPFWRVSDQVSPPSPGASNTRRQFAFLQGPAEHSSNEDIHLALVVEHQGRGTVHIKCFRNGAAYGERVACSEVAIFQSSASLNALVIKRPPGPGRTVVKYARLYGEALSDNDIKDSVLLWMGVGASKGDLGVFQATGDLRHPTIPLHPGSGPVPLYQGELDQVRSSGSQQSTRHSFIIVWDGPLTDDQESRMLLLEQTLLGLKVDLVSLRGISCTAKTAFPQCFIKGHLITQELESLKERGLETLQEALGAQVSDIMISEPEADGTSSLEVLEKQLPIPGIALDSRRPLEGLTEVGENVVEATYLELHEVGSGALAPPWDALQSARAIDMEGNASRQSVEISEVTKVTKIPVGAPEFITPPVVSSLSELNLAARDEAPVEGLEPSSPNCHEYAEDSEVVDLEAERTTSFGERAGMSSVKESTVEVSGEGSDPRHQRIMELEREVRKFKDPKLKLKKERRGQGAAADVEFRRDPLKSPENAGAFSREKSHRLDMSKFGFRVLQTAETRSEGMGNTGSGGILDDRKTYVWYANFGSLLWDVRFLCSIKGGMLDITDWANTTASNGTTDPAPPTAKETFLIRRRLFFGDKALRGDGGSAFLMPFDVPGAESTAILRAYRITLEQFNDLVAQENGIPLSDMAAPFIAAADLSTLRSGHASPPGLASLQEEEYGNILYLGDHAGEPVLTLTCSEGDADKYLNGTFGTRAPSEPYKQALVTGLMSVGLRQREAELYWNVRGTVPLTQGTG